MVWLLNPVGAVGVAVGLWVFALAGFLYFARPDRTQNRRLAVVLYLEATIAATGTGLLFLTDHVATIYGLQAVTIVAVLALPTAYLRFLGTLDTPLSAPFRIRWVDRVLVALTLLAPVLYFVDPDGFVGGIHEVWFAPYDATLGPHWETALGIGALVFLYGIFVTIHAWRRGRTEAVRRKGAFVASAFGVRDLFYIIVAMGPVFLPALSPDTRFGSLMWASGPPVVLALYTPLVVYGILSAQLFDIDIRIKAGVRRSLLGGAFLVAFIVGAEVTEQFISERASNGVGLAAAVTLAFAFKPLERSMARLTDRLFPNVDPQDPAYLERRKHEVYRAALEASLVDGVIDADEQRLLARLAGRLGLGDETAVRLREEVMVEGGLEPVPPVVPS